jgi:hypothetical protein
MGRIVWLYSVMARGSDRDSELASVDDVSKRQPGRARLKTAAKGATRREKTIDSGIPSAPPRTLQSDWIVRDV